MNHVCLGMLTNIQSLYMDNQVTTSAIPEPLLQAAHLLAVSIPEMITSKPHSFFFESSVAWVVQACGMRRHCHPAL